MGQAHVLAATSFEELGIQALTPVPVPVTREEFHALPKAERDKVKAVTFVVAATFKGDQSPRQTPLASPCNLLTVDVDDPVEAQRMLTVGFDTLLGELGAVVWHTASSTPEAPRLRVVVNAAAVPVARYAEAIEAIASLLGMNEVNRESKVPVQPMYLPVQFKGEAAPQPVYANLDGSAFEVGNMAVITPLATESKAGFVDPGMGDLDYLRAPMEGITKEEITEALEKVDANCGHQQWVEMGMSLKHQFGPEGLDLWDTWSEGSDEKYPGRAEMEAKWASFKGQTKDRVPVTVRSVIRAAVMAGWNNKAMGTRLFTSVHEWVMNPVRSSEELLDQGTKRIAKLAGVAGDLEQATLVRQLSKVLNDKKLFGGVTPASLTKAVNRLKRDAMQASGTLPPWAKDIVYLTGPDVFYRFKDNRKFKPKGIDLIYRSPNPELSASQYLINDAHIPVVENVMYAPHLPAAQVITIDGCPYINTYRASYAPPDPAMMAVCGQLYEEHCLKLNGPPQPGDQSYTQVWTDYIAFLVQHPGVKVRWAPVIQSALGAGKGMLAEIIAAVIGPTNIKRISAEHVVEGSYNGWAVGAQLVSLDEVRMTGTNRHRAMDKLKPMLSENNISVRDLYEPVRQAMNVSNYIIFTNYQDALPVHKGDRRYWVVYSPLQTKEQVLAVGANYFTKLGDMIADHPGGFRAYFESHKISQSFKPNGHAPETHFLRELAATTSSPLLAAVEDALHDQPHALVQNDLVSATTLRAVIEQRAGVPQFSDPYLGSILLSLGFVRAGRHVIDGYPHNLWAKENPADALRQALERLQIL